MGHLLKGDVDLMHYNCQSEDELMRIYDKFGIDIFSSSEDNMLK